MSTIAVAGVHQQVLAIRRQQALAMQPPQTHLGTVRRTNPLVSVLTWEMRRFLNGRRFWLQALGFFCFLLLLTWAQSRSFVFSTRSANGFVVEPALGACCCPCQ